MNKTTACVELNDNLLTSLVGWAFGLPGVTFECPSDKLESKRFHLSVPFGLPV